MIISIKKTNENDDHNILEVLYEIIFDNLSKLDYYTLSKAIHHRAVWYVDLGEEAHVVSFQVIHNPITDQFDLELYEIVCDDITVRKTVVTNLNKAIISDFKVDQLNLVVDTIISAIYVCMMEGNTDIDLYDNTLTSEKLHDLGYINWSHEVNIYSNITQNYQVTDPFCCYITFDKESTELLYWHRKNMVNDCADILSTVENTVDAFLQNRAETTLSVSVFNETDNFECLYSDDFVCRRVNNVIEDIYVLSSYSVTPDSSGVKVVESQLIKAAKEESIKEKIVDLFIEKISVALTKHESECNVLTIYDNRPELNYREQK